MPSSISPAIALVCIVATFGWLSKPVVAQTPKFVDNFNTKKLDTTKWLISERPYGSVVGLNKGQFLATNIDLSSGMLRIKITSDKDTLPTGGEIQSKSVFGYGTYDFTMRMTTTSETPNGPGRTASGSCASGFTFVNRSETELDIEFLGDQPDNIHFTTWMNPTPDKTPTPTIKQHDGPSIKGLADSFHTYRILWMPGKVQYFVDGKLLATHTKNVPDTPAHIILNHRAMNNRNWGGLSTLGITRYSYVSNVSYTPLEGQ